MKSCLLYVSLSLTLFFWAHLTAERGSSFPFISGDTFRACADYTYDELAKDVIPENVQSGDIIFVKTDYIGEFFGQIHSRIANPYILITHNSDYGVPGANLRYLNDDKLIAWFGQNVESVHPKLHPIPIGIANRCWAHGNIEIFRQAVNLSPLLNKVILLYMNFQIGTRYDERSSVYNLFCNKPFCLVSGPKPLPNYLMEISQSKFILSPRGNGLDTHRTWEALLCGAIPIVRSSALDSMYDGLPVLVIDDWGVITEDFLNSQYQNMQTKSFYLEKIYADYWINKIQSYKYLARKQQLAVIPASS